MPTPLRVLIAEDRPADAELMVYELSRSGFQPDWKRVESEEQYLAELQTVPDVILADNTLPQFNAPQALELLKKSNLDIPLIVVTGSISEEVAVERIKQGAADYILKDRMTRLGEAVKRALEDKKIRDQKRLAEEETQRNLERIRALHEIDLAITSTLDLRMVLEFLLNKIDVFLPQSSATTIRLFNKESGLLEPVACRNLNEAAWKAEVGRAGRGLANVAVETKVPLMVRNAQADPRTRDREFFTRYGLVSYLGVPLMAKREVLGVLGFYTKEEHQFGDDEIDFLKTLAGQAAIAIHNAKLYEETKTLTRRNELILTSAGEGIYGVDLEGKTTFINPAAAKMLGYEPSELIGQRMHALAHHSKPDGTFYRKEECPIYAAFMDGAIHHIDDEVFWHKDGTSFWVEYVSTPVRENGKILGAVVTFKDITERKKAEEDLRARYQELQTLHEIGETILTAPDLKTTLERILDEAVSIGPFDLGTILLVDPSGEKIEAVASRGYQDPTNLQRRPREEVLGRAQYRALSYEKTYVVENVAEADGLRTLKKEGVQSAVLTPVRAGEKTLGFIQVGSRTQRKFNPDKIRLLEAIGNQMGVAIQKARLYEETQRNLERIRALHEIDTAITSTLDLRAVLDVLLEKMDLVLPYAATTVRLFNSENGLLEPIACRNLDEKEWKAEAWRGGRGLANIVFETNAPTVIRNAQSDPRIRDREFYQKHKLVSYVGIPLTAKGKTLGVIGFYTKDDHEFTDDEVGFLNTLAGQAAIAIHNAQLYEEMVRSNKVKDEFLSVMSHELRTPLNVVVGYAGMIQDEMLGEINPKQAEACTKIIRRTNDLLDMVNGILYTTSLEANEIKVETHEVNLGDFLNELKSSLSTPPDKDLSLRWDYPSNLPTIRTDSAKLKHVLQNVINNAIKFTEKGTVTISAKRIEDVTDNGRRHVEFKVADTGIGIPKEKVPIIFDKFYQVDSSETRLYGGVGLGLYIAREFSHLIGGKIEVESEPGKGSTFTVTIPYEN
jgi:PAS domain S-box-containing protein